MTATARLGCALVVLAACGEDSTMTAPDAATTGDGGIACTLPSLDPPWLRDQITEILSGLQSPRATTIQRNAARQFLRQELDQLGLVGGLQAYPTGANVVAEIEGPSDAPRLILGAHFDTVANSPGANDNASGVAAVFAVARYLTEMPCRRHPVTVVLFDEEESGLVGARAYVDSLGGAAAASVLAVHTIDQVGWDSDGDRRFEIEMPTPALAAAYQAAASVIGVPVTTTPTEGTDHEAFRNAGYAAVGVTEEYLGGDTSPYRHTAQDTSSTLDLEYLERSAQLVMQVLGTALRP